jgi:hypothetical protein
MTEKIKHFVGRVPYATHTTHRIPAPRFDQASGRATPISIRPMTNDASSTPRARRRSI